MTTTAENRKSKPLVNMTFTAVFTSLCIALPLAFHSIPNAGSIFSPMHLPVLLCGLICGWPYGLVCGLLGPLLSAIITGMPMLAYLPAMMIELAIYGAVSGLMMSIVHTTRTVADVYISLITAMLCGRVAAGILNALIFSVGSYSFSAWAAAYFVTCWPAIVIQLILIQPIYYALEKSKLIPKRY